MGIGSGTEGREAFCGLHIEAHECVKLDNVHGTENNLPVTRPIQCQCTESLVPRSLLEVYFRFAARYMTWVTLLFVIVLSLLCEITLTGFIIIRKLSKLLSDSSSTQETPINLITQPC